MANKPGPAPDAKRRKQAQALRRKGLTLREVGERLKPPASRQAVHRMLAKTG